ncbi:outer membrane protein assembly factor BamB family protein [Natrinema salaciae]|uniref:Outer membrane protein assembly factor BamB, contains PQQ-like beta-propeller repeat n=1 Tax=Natrinema salaciae TaxID=1186196 RepID=A0A1H9MWT8_9EURY|nr:PQQ-binding-like beta-propeller repeat protein [Natrinema salaciae]SER28128.1 Outer membrane protein assembly factor BamB, contains PQQ-like beta-propeller repeat [Natrinema salaciae]
MRDGADRRTETGAVFASLVLVLGLVSMAGIGGAAPQPARPVDGSLETNGVTDAASVPSASASDGKTIGVSDRRSVRVADRNGTEIVDRNAIRTGARIAELNLTPTALDAADGTAGDPTVYVGSNDGNLYALDTRTGEIEWSFEAESKVLSSPTVADGTVYVGDDEGFVHAIDAADGTERWSFDSEKEFGEVFSSPTVVDGTVYVGAYDSIWDEDTLYALDAETGSEQWSFDTGGDVYSSPTVVDGTVYIGSNDNNVYAIDADDGTEEWRFETGHFVRSAPTVVDGTVYVGSYDGSLYALDAASGAETWSFDTGDDVYASPTVADGTVYIRSDDVYAVDAADGDAEWSAGAGSWGGSSPTISGGTVYVGSDDGNLYALDAESGSERWSFGTGDRIRSTPAVFNETVYVGSLDGRAYAVDADDGSERWAAETGSSIYSSPTVAERPADGDSSDSRVALGTLGHHEGWDGSSNSPVSGTVVDEFDRPIAGSNVEVRSERRGTVGTTETGDDGTWSLTLDEGTYDVVAAADGASETRTVRHVGAETTTTHSLSLCDGRDVRYGPESPSIVEPVAFRSCVDGDAGADDTEWDFGDGTTANGHAVSHRYDEPGTYNVTLTTDGETVTTSVTVADADIVIREYQDAFGGRIVESVVEENLYRIRVGSVEPVESVTVELDGETYEATRIDEAEGVWETAVNTSTLEDDATVTITATDVEGNEVTETSSLEVITIPDEFVFLLDVGDKGPVPAIAERVEYEGTSGSLIPATKLGLFEITVVDDANEYDELGPLTPWRTDLGFNLTAKMGIGTTIPAGTLNVDGDINGETSVAGNTVRGGGGAKIAYDGSGLANGSKVYFFAGLKRSIPLSPPALPDGVEVVIGGDVRTEFTTDGEGDWDITAGAGVSGETPVQTNVAPGVDLSASAGLKVDSKATFDTPPGLEFKRGTIGVQGFVRGKLDATVYSQSVAITWPKAEAEFGSSSASAASRHWFADDRATETEFGDWEVENKRGENPLPSVATVDESAGTLDVASGAERTGTERLTGRPYEDTEPAVTSVGNETVVLWSTQRENRSVLEGRDLVVRTHDESGWSEPTNLTDDDRHDASPTIAAGGGDELLAGWTRTDADLEDVNASAPEEVYPHQEIAVAHYDGSGWSEQTLLTDSDELTHGPTVAGRDGTWLVAWERDPDGDVFTTDNRSVEYAVLDGTNVTERGVVDDAMSPAVGSSDGGFELSYYEPQENGTERGAVVRGTVTDDGAFDERARYDSREYIDHDTDGGRLAWADGSLDDPNLSYDDGTGVENLSLSANMSDVEELSLEVEGNDTLLSYRGRPETDRASDLVYRIARGGEWIADRRVAGGQDDELALYHSDTDLSGNSFDTVYAASEFGPDTKNDVFVASHDFRADYTVTADAPTNVTAGDPVTVEYAVRNVGETENNESVPVTLSTDGGEVATEAVGPLAPNETVSGTFNTTADDSGTFDVTVGSSATDRAAAEIETGREGWLPRTTSVTTGTPALSIEDADATVDANNSSQGTIAVTVANDGEIPAADVPVTLEYGNESYELAVDDVPVDGTGTATLSVDPTTVNGSSLGEFVIDPDGELDERTVADPTYRTQLFTADLALVGSPSYVEADGDLEATVDVANRGELATNATVRAIDADPGGNETVEYGTATVELDGTAPSETTFETVSVPLEGVAEGDAIRLVADSSAIDADRSSAGLEDAVGPIVPERGPVAVAVTDPAGDPIPNATVLIDDVGATTDANGTAAFETPTGDGELAVNASGFRAATANVTVTGDEVTAVSVTLEPIPAELTALDAPDRVAVDGNATVSVTVANPAPIERDVPLALAAANETVDESSVTVGPNATANHTLRWNPTSNATDPVPITVSSPHDEATTEIRVENGSAFADDLAVAGLAVSNVSVDEEHVVLANNGSSELDLGDWMIRDRESGGQVARGLDPFAFPTDYTLEPNATVTVWTGDGTNSETDLYWGYSVHVWNAEGDVVILETPGGERVLEHAYGDQAD